MSDSRSDTPGLYARIRVRPAPDCILRRLSEDHSVQRYTPGTPGGHQPQVVVEPDSSAPAESLEDDTIEEIMWVGERAVCLIQHSETLPECDADRETATLDQSTPTTGSATDCEMVLYGFSGLPVPPVATRFSDGWIELHLVTTAYATLRETVSALREAAFDVDLRQVVQSDRASGVIPTDDSTLSTVDLSVLTDRQHEVASVSIELGYFETDGASATEVADSLGVSKSTLSEHLRIVIRKLLSQIIP